MVTVSKNDFIKLEFTGKIKGTDEVFDTNIKADAEKAGMDIKDIKPFSLSVGNKMLPTGFDKDLEGKEIGKSHSLELQPADAFGKRNPQLVRMIPTKHFHEQKIDPQRGMQLNLDGQLVKILSNSGGRTLVDFNNPLAGKVVTYDYKILGKIEDEEEKINALQDFLIRKRFDFDLSSDKKSAVFKVEKQFEQFIEMLAPKFEEILGIKIKPEVVEAKEESKEAKKE
jgi:FKBP-type peptidyl-prolyl cis-trans isomerase 2